MIAWNDVAAPENIKATAYALVGGDCQDTIKSLLSPAATSALYPTLRLLARLYHPRRYLEIGVYRGQSAAVVAAGYPGVEIVGIDNWISPKSIGAEESRRFIRARRPSKLTLLTGDSKDILAPSLGIFDLILVDGDHAPASMSADLDACTALLAPGGHIVVHYVFAAHAPACTIVWEKFKAAHKTWEWYEHKVGRGIGVGRKRAKGKSCHMIAWEDIANPENMRETAKVFASIEADDPRVGERHFQEKLCDMTDATEDIALYPMLRYLAKEFRPKRYLEIGVWRAYSTVTVVSACPSVDIVGIDDWSNMRPSTAGEARKRIKGCGHTGQLTLLSGDSRELVNANLGLFDLILVDGCHDIEFTSDDLKNCAPLLAPGGHLVAHDLFAPYAPAHVPLWEAFKEAHPGWSWFEHRVAPGIGIGRRPTEQPLVAPEPDFQSWPFFYRGANADEEWLYNNRHLMHGRIVDVGTPRGIRPFLEDRGTLEILDLSPHIKKFEWECDVDIQADVTDMRKALPDASVDTMIATNILEHVTDPQIAMDEFRRVTKKGGHIFILTPFCYPWHMNPDYWRFTEQGIRLLADRAGFKGRDVISLETTRPAAKALDAYFDALWEGKGDLRRARAIGYSVRCILRRGE